MPPLRVLVADDEQLIRAALRVFIDSADGIELLAEAVNGAEAVEISRRSIPDVVLMDLQMPVMDGVEATAAITSQQPDVRVLILTTLASDRRVIEAIRAGASGYLVKDSAPEEVIAAIRAVSEGGVAVSSHLAHALVAEVQRSSESGSSASETGALTSREMSILRLLAEGKSNGEIATSLHLSEATVKANLGRIMRKWAVRDRVQVLLHATRLGLVALQ